MPFNRSIAISKPLSSVWLKPGLSLGLLALSLGLQAGLPALAASLTALEGLVLESNQASTRLYLHSNSPIAHQTIELTPNLLVLELEDVKAANQLPTSFAKASNIDSVQVRHLPGNRIRLTISGRNLTEPVVGFREGGHSAVFPADGGVFTARTAAPKALVSMLPTAIKATVPASKPVIKQAQPVLPGSGKKPIALPVAKPTKALQQSIQQPVENSAQNPVQNPESAWENQPLESTLASEVLTSSGVSSGTSSGSVSEPLAASPNNSISNTANRNEANSANPASELFSLEALRQAALPWLQQHMDTLLQGSLLGLLALGLAGFIALKWKQLNSSNQPKAPVRGRSESRLPYPYAQEALAQQAQPTRSTSGRTENAYTGGYVSPVNTALIQPALTQNSSQNTSQNASLNSVLSQYQQHNSKGATAQKPRTPLVGKGLVGKGLTAREAQASQLSKPQKARQQEEALAASAKARLLQQVAQPAKAPNLAPSLANRLNGQPVAKAGSAMAMAQRSRNTIEQAARQGEGNPEVLDFLRSVAAHMER